MRVRFHRPNLESCPRHEAKYTSMSQLFLSHGNEYEVHAVSVYDGVTFLLVIDDLDTPTFRARTAFSVVESAIPPDWVCSVFDSGSIQLVLGPKFIAQDVASYNAMVDQEWAQVERLWARLEAHRGDSGDED